MQVITRLIESIRSAAAYNPEVGVAPSCILWTDKERQWEKLIPRLQTQMPELLKLGSYNPEQKSGPAIWVRYVLGGKAPEIIASHKEIPIIYLPGVSRADLRAIEKCPEELKPIAELVYQGNIWSQANGKDITVLAFLSSEKSGLALKVARDHECRNAMQTALLHFIEEDIGTLKDKILDKHYFNNLLTGGDPTLDLLRWLDQGDAYRNSRGENEWRALVETWKSQLDFHADKEGLIIAAGKLALHNGPWRAVWDRFCEAPAKYPNIPGQIRKSPMPDINLFSDVTIHGGWPQWNDLQEIELRKALKDLEDVSPKEVRNAILALEKQHGARRKLVWSCLNQSPLACVLEHLAIIAEGTNKSVAGTFGDIIASYSKSGWKVDNAVLNALACTLKQEDFTVVKSCIRSMYTDWADDSARHLQNIVMEHGYPNDKVWKHSSRKENEPECIMFVDGLRFDVARRVEEYLSNRGLSVDAKPVWAALPSITETGKPAVAPVTHLLSGKGVDGDFEPIIIKTNQPLKGGQPLRKLLQESGWQVIGIDDIGEPSKSAWCEFGDLDKEGHTLGWKMARHIDEIVPEIGERVIKMLQTGWKKVRIVTDHGWLLLPGGLPKVELSPSLTINKWGRIATIKAGALCDEKIYKWSWDSENTFTVATGIGCYRAGEEYSHGGLSLQECLNLELTVSSDGSGTKLDVVQLLGVKWTGLRCNVQIKGDDGFHIDLRLYPGDPSSSIITSKKAFNNSGVASVVVENEDLEGSPASIVILDTKGQTVGQRDTIVGGGEA